MSTLRSTSARPAKTSVTASIAPGASPVAVGMKQTRFRPLPGARRTACSRKAGSRFSPGGRFRTRRTRTPAWAGRARSQPTTGPAGDNREFPIVPRAGGATAWSQLTTRGRRLLMTVPTTGPLAGVRVLDLAGEAGVFVGRALAELGADVVRAESGADRVRQREPFLDGVGRPGAEPASPALQRGQARRRAGPRGARGPVRAARAGRGGRHRGHHAGPGRAGDR